MATFSDPTLYVGDLHRDVVEIDLLQIFSPQQGFIRIKLPKNHNSSQIFGYAYINFSSIEEAVQAIENHNYKNIKGRQIRLMLYQRDFNQRNLQCNNMIVKNLDKHCTSSDLFNYVKDKYGKDQIVSCSVKTNSQGKSKKYGFVQFSSEEIYKKALEEMNGQKINESDQKAIIVCEFKKQTQRQIEDNFNNLYIKNLPNDVTEQQLKDLFAQFGEITSIVIRQDTQSRTYAFLCFKNFQSAKQAVEVMNDKEYLGQKLYVTKHLKRDERNQVLNQNFAERKDQDFQNLKGLNLYIKNLHQEISEKELKELFQKFGEITSVKIEKSSNLVKKDSQFQLEEKSKGFGFVCFQTHEAAEKAQKEMHGSLVIDQHIYVNFAQKKEERQQKLKKIKQSGLNQQSLCNSHKIYGMFGQPYNKFRQNPQTNFNQHQNNHHMHQHYNRIPPQFSQRMPNQIIPQNNNPQMIRQPNMMPNQRYKMTMIPFQMPYFMP